MPPTSPITCQKNWKEIDTVSDIQQFSEKRAFLIPSVLEIFQRDGSNDMSTISRKKNNTKNRKLNLKILLMWKLF